MNCDGIKTMRDSIQTNAAAIADLQSADAAITNRMNTISDSVKTNFDNIAGNTSKLNALQNRVNVFNTHVCDTVMNCDGIKDMRDSLGNAFDTLKYYYDTSYVNQTLKQYLKTGALCDSIVKCDVIKDMRDSLGNAFDTLKYYYDTSYVNQTLKQYLKTGALCDSIVKCDVIKDMRDSLGNAFDTLKYYFDSTQVKKAIHDSIGNGTLTIAITNGSTTIFKANDKNNKTVTLAKVAETGSYNDLSDIPTPPTVNDYAVIVNLNGTSAGSFTLNQSTNAVVNLDSVAVTKKGTTNTYKNTNDFTGGTITVPSNGTAIPRPANSDPNSCNNNNAVAVCDLLAMFDSLSNRIQGVFDSLKYLNDSLANELEALKNTIPPTAYAPTIKNLTSTSLTVKANNTSSGAAITSYEYCYSTNSDMSGATCQTSALDTLDLTGLTPKTDYYVTVKATNSAGSTTSSTTTAHTPTATVNTPTSVPTGFKVEVTGIDPDATTVQVCYKQGTSCSVDDNDYTCAVAQTVASTENANTQAITGLTANTNYCVIVKVSNGDSTTVYGPYTVTTGDIVTLSLTSTGNGNVNLCGGTSVSATYTATPSNGTDNYTYSWNSGTAGTANTYTATYTATGSYTVTCSATHTDGYTLTATATTTVGDSGTAVTMGLCDDGLTVTVKSVSGSPNAISWGDGSTGTSVSEGTTHTYSTSATYTIIASNSAGCMATVTKAFHTTCNLSQMTTSSLLSNERGSSTAIDSVSDHEGNWYEVVQIGTQCWLKENLRTTTSPSTGTYLIPAAGKGNTYTGKQARWYNNNSATYAPMNYGLLYNWNAAVDTFNTAYGETSVNTSNGNAVSVSFTGNRRGICPEGWHLPTDAEWNTMELVVNGGDVSPSMSNSTGYRGSHAGKLSTGCDWNTNNTTANAPNDYSNAGRNSSGFAAVPAGGFYGTFANAGNNALFWSSSQNFNNYAWYRYLDYSKAGMGRNNGTNKYNGFSVRCLRD